MATRKGTLSLPAALLIGGLSWAVRIRARILHKGQRCDGLCRPQQQDILVQRDMSPEQSRITLLHESLHAVFWDCPETFHDEALIERLTERLDAFLRDNPEFRGLY